MSCSAKAAVSKGSASSWWRLGLLFVVAALPLLRSPAAQAHVGSPDVYAEGTAGPYRLLVTVRPPLVIPGVAEIEVRAVPGAAGQTINSQSMNISGIEIAPIPLTGEASKHPPVADAMKRSAQDPNFYTGSLWIMASGSWQVRFSVKGSQGAGLLSIPVPATSSSTLGMQKGLATMLAGLGLLLVMGVVGIIGAAARDAQLPPGATATESGRKRSRIAMAVALVIMIGAVVFGKLWWGSEANDYAKYVYKPLTMEATLGPDSGKSDQLLSLKIEDPGWLKSRKVNDFVLDHDHLMHLYLIRQPGMDVVYHLHPSQVATGNFELHLPSMPAGDYRLYADVVHATGFPETLVSSLTLPEVEGRPLQGDDAKGTAPALATNAACPVNEPGNAAATFRLPDGYTMVWNNASVQPAKTPQVFEFSLLDGSGQSAKDVALYMGMLGHAAFVKDDGSVFAHVHPSGTVSMAALMMAAAQNQPNSAASQAIAAIPEMEDEDTPTDKDRGAEKLADSMAGMNMPGSAGPSSMLPNAVGFPYGFPTPGAYRIFVQMKHGGTVETGSFDACAR